MCSVRLQPDQTPACEGGHFLVQLGLDTTNTKTGYARSSL
jgi:hypothetical protein